MDEPKALTAISALSNATRLRILRRLAKAGDQGLSAGEIGKAVDAAPSRASFHLSAMTEAGLIRVERHSRQMTYRVDFQAVGSLIAFIMHDCCQDNETMRSCCMPKDERSL